MPRCDRGAQDVLPWFMALCAEPRRKKRTAEESTRGPELGQRREGREVGQVAGGEGQGARVAITKGSPSSG